MKNTLAVLLLFFVMAGPLYAQLIPASQVPPLIRNTLAKKHPNARHLEWERAAPYYEAVFTLNNVHRAIKFYTEDRVAETEIGMPIANLSTAVAQYMKKHCPAERIQAAETVTKPNGVHTYEICVTGMEVVFSRTGTFLEKEKD